MCENGKNPKFHEEKKNQKEWQRRIVIYFISAVLHSITYIYIKCIDYKNDSSYIPNISPKNNVGINS
jgi:hypothetical protein